MRVNSVLVYAMFILFVRVVFNLHFIIITSIVSTVDMMLQEPGDALR